MQFAVDVTVSIIHAHAVTLLAIALLSASVRLNVPLTCCKYHKKINRKIETIGAHVRRMLHDVSRYNSILDYSLLRAEYVARDTSERLVVVRCIVFQSASEILFSVQFTMFITRLRWCDVIDDERSFIHSYSFNVAPNLVGRCSTAIEGDTRVKL